MDRGDSWLVSDVLVDEGGSGDVANAVIACDDRWVWLVWEDDRDSALQNHQIYLARSADFGQSFSAEVIVDGDSDGETMSLGPAIAIDGDRVHVVWYDDRHGAYDVFLATSRDAGGHFEAPVRIGSGRAGAAYSAVPTVAAADGRVHVAWEDSRDGASDIYAACSDNAGASFQDEQRLDTADAAGLTSSFMPQLRADGGHVYALWHDQVHGVGSDVYTAFSSACGVWTEGARVNVGRPGFFDARTPTLVTSGDTAHIAWSDSVSTNFDVFYRAVVAGVPVGDPVRLDAGTVAGHSHSFEPVLAHRAVDDQLVVAWTDGRADTEGYGFNDLYYNHASGGGLFDGTDRRIDTQAAGVSIKADLHIALSGPELLSVWSDDRNGTEDVYFNRIRIGDGWEPPPEE